MKMKPVALDEIPAPASRSSRTSEYWEVLNDFLGSKHKAVEIEVDGKKPQTVVSVFSGHLAKLRKEGVADVKCVRRQGKVYLVRSA